MTIPAPHPDNALPWGTVGPADWQEGITAIVGSGPSLAGVDLDVLRSFPAITHTIAVKEAAWDMPWADACVCVDQKWPRRRDLNALPVPLYLCLGEPYVGPIPTGSTFLRRFVHGPLSDRPDALAQGCTSGYAALNFAILKGARKILLLGYDYRHGRDGKHHGRPEWNPWYPPANARLWTYWRDPFNAIAGTLRSRGVVVVNASPGSALDAFPIHPLPCAVARLAGVGPSGRCSLPSGKGEHPAARQPAG